MQVLQSTVAGSFPIIFGEDARELLLEQVEQAAPDKAFIVTDRTVEALHAETIRENLPHSVKIETVVFNEGEQNKNLATLEHVAGDLIRAGATGRSLVLNVGGGVVLNLGGLAASLVGGGLRFAQIPTTFAAQWSALNTNRQAVNFIGARNALGVSRSPIFAIADPFFLETEPERQALAGLVDFARHALVLGGEAFQKASAALAAKDSHRGPGLHATLRAGVDCALSLGARDPEERERAALENYGLAIARALEALADGKLLHMEAVHYGMNICAAAAAAAGIMPEAERARHDALLAAIKIEAPFPKHVRTDQLIYRLHGNNKTVAGVMQMTLLEAVGRPAPESASLSDAQIGQAVDAVRGQG